MGARTDRRGDAFAVIVTVTLGVAAALCLVVTYMVILSGGTDDVASLFTASTIAVVAFLWRLSARSRTRRDRRTGDAMLSTR